MDTKTAAQQQARVRSHGSAEYETPIRRKDGHLAWVTVSISAVQGNRHGAEDASSEPFATSPRNGHLRPGKARYFGWPRPSGWPRVVAEVLSITLKECRTAVDVQRVVAVMWPPGEHSQGEPTVQMAGEPYVSTWRELDPWLRKIFEDARISCR